jgi:hypothetical protein
MSRLLNELNGHAVPVGLAEDEEASMNVSPRDWMIDDTAQAVDDANPLTELVTSAAREPTAPPAVRARDFRAYYGLTENP